MTSIVVQVTELHRVLADRGISHAFGGALALAWCTQRARGTIDIDINVFVEPSEGAAVLDALPAGVTHSKRDLAELLSDGQVRLKWDGTPVDLFLSTTAFHREVESRLRVERFAEADIPFLSCDDLAVFKAFFNRSRDWVDLEEMHAAGTIDVAQVVTVLSTYLGPTDDRIARLLAMED
jgi:hypothetical protein